MKWALGAVAILVAVLVARSFVNDRDARWQLRVERESQRAEEALRLNAEARQDADSLEALADSLAEEAGKRDTVIVTKIKNLPVPPPDCEPFTIPRDEVIVDLRKQNMLVSTAFVRQREAAAQLRIAEAAARSSADSLLAVLDDRPRPASAWLPSVGLGATAGICTTGQPCAAVGLTLSWSLDL